MSTITCKNQHCGKEYHDSFKKCPFCGCENEYYVEPISSEESSSPSGMNGVLRVIISCVFAVVVMVVLATVTVLLNLDKYLSTFVYYLLAGIAVGAGKWMSSYLKKRTKNEN